jgi:hypothetical protein
MFKSHIIKSNHRVLKKNRVDTNAPDYSAYILAAIMCSNSHEHSMYIRFLCLLPFWRVWLTRPRNNPEWAVVGHNMELVGYNLEVVGHNYL